MAPAEALPLPDGSFDAALSQLVVNFMRDARRARARDGARDPAGGVVAACVWDYAGEMTLLRAFWDAARGEPERAAAHDEGVVMRWCREGELAELWHAAGLLRIRSSGCASAAATRTSRTCGRRSSAASHRPAPSASLDEGRPRGAA